MRMKQINPVSSKVKHRLYSPTALTNAYQAVREQGLAVRKASRLYNVPLTTLRDRVDGRISIDVTSSGPDPLLSLEEESRLAEHIKYMSDLGYGYTRAQVCEIASDLAVFSSKKSNHKPMSMTWFYNFMTRWPELHVTKPRSLSAIRAKSASPEAINSYYEELEKILSKYNLMDFPEDIYNIDEKGINTEHKPPSVVSGTDIPPQAITSPRGKTTTIIGCGNALGQQIPPYFVFSGKRKIDTLIEGSTPGTDFDVSESGWSNSEIFENYMKFHFTKFVQPKDGKHILVLYDGHASHVNLSIINWAKERRIILFLLPPHCSHILQPLDVGCFGPLERIYNRECSSYMRSNPGQTITRSNVCKIACKAYSLALSPENLRASFAKAGIYPLNKQAIPQRKLKPSTVFNVENNSNDKQNENQNCEKNEDETEKSTDVQGFFENKTLKVKNEKQQPSKKSKGGERRLYHHMIGGKALTESDTIKIINNFTEQSNKKTNKKAPNKKGKSLKRKSKSPNKNVIPEKQSKSSELQAGPSGIQNARNITHYSEDSLLSDDDAEGDCCVCHKFSPPGLRDCLDLVIVKWAQCDMCGHWTHLRFCTEIRVVRRHSEFLCPHCNN